MIHRLSTLGCVLALLAAAPAVVRGQAPPDEVSQYRSRHAARIIADFAKLLSMPNVAFDRKNIRRNAEYIRDEFSRRGARMELLELPELPEAPPIVFGEMRTPGAQRTLILYVHYDGQPALPTEWTNPPWKPALYSKSLEDGGRPLDWPAAGQEMDPEWRIYARSAGDDKAPLIAILTALDAMKEAGLQPTSNLLFFFEGEEEAGSTHLRSYLEKYRDRLEGDIWLFCDGPVHQSRRPQLVFGVRGIVDVEITVYGASRYLHSGHYGNWAPNPAFMLASLLASMKDERGNVVVEGYYDSVEPLSPEAQRAVAAVPDYDAELRRELGLASTENGNQPYLERLLLPSLNIRGMSSAAVGRFARNIVPTKAVAALDLRMVKGNRPQHMIDLVEAHIRKQGYHIVRKDPDLETRLKHPKIAKVVRGQGYPAARTRMDLPIAQEIIAAARRVAGDDLVLVPTLGGSLPLHLFTDFLRKPVIVVPIANHDNNQHAPDENLRLANLWYGIDLMAKILTMP